MMTGKSNKRKQAGNPRKKSPQEIFDDIDADFGKLKDSGGQIESLRDQTGKQRNSRSIFEALLNISASINSTLNQRELLKEIVDAVIFATDCDRGFLMLREATGELSFAIARSKDKKELDESAFKVSRSIIDEAAGTGEPVVIDDIENSDAFRYQQSVVDLDLKSAYSIPLKYQDMLVGIIYVDRNRLSHRFSKTDLSILKAFGAQAAVAIENAKNRGELELSLRNLKKHIAGQDEFFGIIGCSKSFQKIVDNIKTIAPFSTSVLIQGEQGTGKELIARAIHDSSPRKDATFKAINCGAIPGGLLESELFGHTEGAFTGAIKARKGAFEEANGGTLLLDEIGEMPQEMQVKLLRVLQENEITPVGGGESDKIKVDVRIISATNKNLTKEVEEGRFRGDLFYRLNVMPIEVPPLRDRERDIIVLAEHFLEKHARLNDLFKPRLTRDAREFLLQFDWPGNVRELENRIERAVVMCHRTGVINAEALERDYKERKTNVSSGDIGPLKEMLDNTEAEIIRKTLIKNDWNITKAAEILGISRQVLHTKIKKYKLSQDN